MFTDHTKTGRVSAYVSRCVDQLNLAREVVALDIPAGYGRNTFALAEAGHIVVAVDIEARRLQHVVSQASLSDREGNVFCVQADGRHALPFRDASFDLIIVVHLVIADFVARVTPLLRPGGHLIFESFGGQGGNWQSLPSPGAMRAELQNYFAVLDYQETLVGPTKSEAVAVRFLACRL